jgi:hypothetical protein
MAQVPRAPLDRVQTNAAANVFQSTNIPQGAFGDKGVGLKNAGAGISKLADQVFEVELENRKEDDNNDLQQRILNYRQDLLEQQNGEDGWAHLTGQAALDKQEEFRKKSQDSQSKHSQGANPRVLARYNIAAGKHALGAESSRGEHLVRQRKTAADVTDTATSKMANEEMLNNPFGPNVSRNIIEIIDSQARIAERAGITQANNPAAYELIVKGAVTQAHSGVIASLEKTGRIQEAQEYFKKYGSSMTAAARAQSKSLIIDGLRSKETDQALDRIIVTPVPEGKSAATFRLEQARSHPDPEVRKELVQRTRLYNMDQLRAKVANDKQTMEDIISASNTGQRLTAAQRRFVDKTKGLGKLVELNQAVFASGQPRVSDALFMSDLSTMRTKDEAAFLKMDFDDPVVRAKLSVDDRTSLKAMQEKIKGVNEQEARRDKKQNTKNAKIRAKALQSMTAERDASGLINAAIDSSVLTKANRPDFDRKLTEVLARRTANGETLTPKQNQDIVRSLLRVQVSTPGTFINYETPLFSSPAGTAKVSLEDWTSDNKDLLTTLAAEANMEFNTAARISKHISDKGQVPTPGMMIKVYKESVAKKVAKEIAISSNLSDDELPEPEQALKSKTKDLLSKKAIKLSTKSERNIKTAAEAHRSASPAEKAIFKEVVAQYRDVDPASRPTGAEIQAIVNRKFKASPPERKKLAEKRMKEFKTFISGVYSRYRKNSAANKKALDAALKSRRKGAVAKAKAAQKKNDNDWFELLKSMDGDTPVK